MRTSLWIIGYGNRHRRDDGIGCHIIEALEQNLDLDSAWINTLSLHQLEPELSEDLQTASEIIFVDATHEISTKGRIWKKILPISDISGISHGISAGTLLGLTRLLYNRCPPARMVAIQGRDFGFGQKLSRFAENNARKAINDISRVIHLRTRKDRLENSIQPGHRKEKIYG